MKTYLILEDGHVFPGAAMTYPMIGNYGVCRADMESAKPWTDALIVREIAGVPSNFRSGMSIDAFLKENGIPGISAR